MRAMSFALVFGNTASEVVKLIIIIFLHHRLLQLVSVKFLLTEIMHALKPFPLSILLLIGSVHGRHTREQ